MKFSNILVLTGIALLSLTTACNDWLDVNVDPNNPTDQSAMYYKRLAPIEYHTNQCYQTAAEVSNYTCGDYVTQGRTHARGRMAQWYPTSSFGRAQSIAQSWHNGAACNFKVYFETAEAAGATHYVGVGHLLRAYGFMVMNDFFGDNPMSDADGSSGVPAYDTGKEMFTQILEEIELGLEYLQKPQSEGAESLAYGDYIGNGDVNKWIKFGNLIKARQLLKLSKKGPGSYTDLKYDADEILRCLDKAQKSNADGLIIAHTDINGEGRDPLGLNERLDFNTMYSNTGMNSNHYFTESAVKNLTNFDAKGIEDPRADRILPWVRSAKSANSPANIKWSSDGKWRRTAGVDMSTPIRIQGGPLANTFRNGVNSNGKFEIWYCNTTNPDRQGDTIYIHGRCGSKGYGGHQTLLLPQAAGDFGKMSGSFWFRPTTPGFFSTFHEACFIKAEVLFNKGDKSGAFEAYKNGVRAHMELMNDQLKKWSANPADVEDCPSFVPMTDAEINNYINSALGNSGDLTLGKIMTQKKIAMFCSNEPFNDMRRYDYNTNIFLNWNIPYEYTVNTEAQRYIPIGKYPRRWQVNNAELLYNVASWQAIGPKVPGANNAYPGGWQCDPEVWTIPIWWDSDQN